MKCPIDQTEMKEGVLFNSRWIEGGEPMGGLNPGILFMGRKKYKAIAHRCPKCGKVELYTEPEKKEEK